jgi:hypothetical protein
VEKGKVSTPEVLWEEVTCIDQHAAEASSKQWILRALSQ